MKSTKDPLKEKKVHCTDKYKTSSKMNRLITKTGMEYPVENGDAIVPDYYHWLENIESEEVKTWLEQQNSLTQQALKNTHLKKVIAKQLADLLSEESFSLCSRSICGYKNDELFYLKKEKGKKQGALYRKNLKDGKEKLLFEPETLGGDGSVAIACAALSDDASKIEMWLMKNGSMKNLTKKSLDIESDRTEKEIANTRSSEIRKILEKDGGLINFILKDGYAYIHTHKNAPNRAVYRAPLQDLSERNWELIIPESKYFLNGIKLMNSSLIAVYNEEGSDTVKQYSLEGKLLSNLDLPSPGMIYSIDSNGTDNLMIHYRSLKDFSNIYLFDGKTQKLEKIIDSKIPPISQECEINRLWCSSKDGTKIPMFIVNKKGLRKDGKNPTILSGYGGFTVNPLQFVSPAHKLWVENGGVFVMANLRGGGEFGSEWYWQGILEKKQNTFDDFAAVAEYLIKSKVTSPKYLGIHGVSGGGLLTAASLVQHPELFGAVCMQSPATDMLRYDKFSENNSYEYWATEFGSSSNPEQVEFLLKYSPLHSIVPGEKYPATLIITGDHDDHVFVGHSYKMAASLQHANKSDSPILLRVIKNVGHWEGKPTDSLVEEQTEVLYFFAKYLNLDLKN